MDLRTLQYLFYSEIKHLNHYIKQNRIIQNVADYRFVFRIFFLSEN